MVERLQTMSYAPAPSPPQFPQVTVHYESEIGHQPEFLAAQYPDLQSLLTCLGLEKYLDTFVAHSIDLVAFMSLTEGDLKRLGVSLLGPRKKMLSAIEKYSV